MGELYLFYTLMGCSKILNGTKINKLIKLISNESERIKRKMVIKMCALFHALRPNNYSTKCELLHIIINL